MADVKAMVRDPEFQALPWKERHQLLAMKDPEYAALPSEDQAAVMNDLKSRDWWQPATAEKPQSSVVRSSEPPVTRDQFIEQESANSDSDKRMYKAGTNRMFGKAEPADVQGIATPSDRTAAQSARTFVKEDIPAIAKTAGAKVIGGAESSLGGMMQAYGEENTNRYNVSAEELAQSGAGRLLNRMTAADDAQRAGIAQRGMNLGNEGRAVIQAANEDQPIQTRAGRIVDSTVQSIGANAPGMAASIATGNPAIGLTAMGLQTFGQTYDESRAKGLSVEEATQNAAIQGGTEVATEMLPFLQLSKFMKPGKLSTKMLHYYLSEVPGEQVATAVQNATGKAFDHPGMTSEERKAAALDYLASNAHAQDQIDTFFTTILQSAVLGGAVKVAQTAGAKLPSATPAAQPAPSGPLSRAVSRVDATAVTPQSAFNDAVAAKDNLAAVVGDEAANEIFAKADEQVAQTGEQDGARYYQQVQQALNAELERAKAQPATEAIPEQTENVGDVPNFVDNEGRVLGGTHRDRLTFRKKYGADAEHAVISAQLDGRDISLEDAIRIGQERAENRRKELAYQQSEEGRKASDETEVQRHSDKQIERNTLLGQGAELKEGLYTDPDLGEGKPMFRVRRSPRGLIIETLDDDGELSNVYGSVIDGNADDGAVGFAHALKNKTITSLVQGAESDLSSVPEEGSQGAQEMPAVRQEDVAPYQYQPLDTDSPLEGKVFYHGTKAPIDKLTQADPLSRADINALFGPGLYLTDSKEIAQSYAETKGKGPTGKVLSGKLGNVRLLDLEKPVPQNVKSVFQSYSEELGLPVDGETGVELYASLAEGMRDNDYTTGDAMDLLGGLQATLEDMGYDGFRHIGGSRTRMGKNHGPHNVAILFDTGHPDKPVSTRISDYEETTTPQGATNDETAQADAEGNEGHADEARNVQAPAEGDAQENADDGRNEAALQARGRNEDAQRDEGGVAAFKAAESVRQQLASLVGEKVANDIANKIDTRLSDEEGPARSEMAGPGGRGAVFYGEFQKEMQKALDDVQAQASNPDSLVARQIKQRNSAALQRAIDFMNEADRREANELADTLENKRVSPQHAQAIEDALDSGDNEAVLDAMYTAAEVSPDKLKLVKSSTPDSTRAILSTLATPKRKSDASIAKLTAAHGRDAVNQLVTSGLIAFPGKGMAELTKKGRDHLSTLPRPLSPLEEKQLANLAKNGKRTAAMEAKYQGLVERAGKLAAKATVTEQGKKLAEVKGYKYKTSNLKHLLEDKDGFDPDADGFHAELLKYAYPPAKAYNDIMEAHNGNPSGVEFKSKDSDRYAFVTPEMSGKGKYRVQYFDSNGFSSHAEHPSLEEAVEEMVKDGFRIESRGALDELSATDSFQNGNAVSAMIGKVNSGEMSWDDFIKRREEIYAPKAEKEWKPSVGDTVYFEDAFDSGKRHPANFRGFNGDNAVVVWNGSQMSLDRKRLFKENVAAPVQTKDKKADTPAKVVTPPKPKTSPKVNRATDDVVVAISKLGGIDFDEATSQWGDVVRDSRKDLNNHVLRQTRRFGAVFKKGGKPLDKMRESLVGHGYLPDTADLHDLYSLIEDATRGKVAVSAENAQESELEREAREYEEREIARLSEAEKEAHNAIIDALEDDDTVELGDTSFNFGYNTEGYDAERDIAEVQGYLEDPDAAAAGEGDSAGEAHLEQGETYRGYSNEELDSALGNFHRQVSSFKQWMREGNQMTATMRERHRFAQDRIDTIKAEKTHRAQNRISARKAQAQAEVSQSGVLTITKAERKEIMRTVGDVYKDAKAPREIKGFDRNGNEIFGYVYSPEYFVKSDLSGKPIRHYVMLPDGRIAHPDEIFDAVSRGRIRVESELEQTDDAGGWQQQVGVEGKKQVPTIGGVQQQGGRRVDTSSLMDGFTPEPPSLFSTKSDTPSPLTLTRVRSSFPNQQITEDNGTFTVTTPSGVTIRISTVGEIEFDRKAAEEAYGREILPGEKPVAEFKPLDHSAVINLTERGVGELDHETFHASMSLALRKGQRDAVLRKYGNEEKAAAEYQRLKDSGAFEEKRGNIYLAAIFRFFRNLRELIAPTAKGAMQDVASGRVWGRAKQGRGGTKYAAAWHGSPHDFDKFSTDKLGTGEGAAAYGVGLYFASNRDVAEYYRKNVSGYDSKAYIDGRPLTAGSYGYWPSQFGISRQMAERLNDWRARVESGDATIEDAPASLRKRLKVEKSGRLYHVELAPTSDEYLDWDKPLSEQSEKVKAALADEFAALREQYKGRDPLKMTGAEFYKGLADTDREASEMLHSLGVRGIKYLDGTSRGKGEGNYNYVIFNESDVEIKAKYSLKSAFDRHSPAQLKAAVTVHPKVQALVGSVFNNGRNVNMWMRTVGTMYHTAEKLAAEGKPQFKAVFDKGQQFLSDVSAIAMQAEALAPDLFPKMGTGKGLFHNLSRKDAQAIADPLFQGTLFGGANPVNGKVFTPAELKRIFGLNDHQIELYRQARAAVDQSLDDMAKSLIARNAKEASAPFDRDMELSEMAQDVTDSINTLIADKKAALDQYEKDYQASIKTATPDQLKTLEKEHKKLTREQEATIDLYESLVQNIDNLAKKTEALKKRGYFPLMRFGEYTVTMKDRDGKVEYFGLFESAFKAKLMEDKLKKDNPASTVTQAVMGREKFKLYGGMNLEALQLFAEHLGADETAPYQEYLKVGLNNRSAMKRLIHRKGTEGFSEDAVRTLANFIVSNARHASTQYHLHDMRKLAAEIPEDTQGDVQDQAVKLYEYLTKPREEATKLRGYLFFHYLGGSLASGIVNMTQPLMMTTPYLASKTSLKNAIRHLTMASSNAFTDPKNVKGDLGIALRRAEAEGVTAPQEIYQLTAMASNKLLASNPYANAALKAWGGFFSVAEAFNRRTTFIAAYRVAKENGKKDAEAYKEAAKAVTETQFVYNKGNRPNWARGIIGAPLFTFKQFGVMYLELFNRLPKKSKGIMLGLLWLMAGMQGLPFAEDAEDIIDTIGQWMGHATNSKQWINQKAEDALGKTAGKFLTSGVSSVLPLDLQSRFGMGNLIPATSILKQSEVDKGRDIKEWFGAAGGLLASLGDALSLAAIGSYGRAVLAASPRAVQSVAQGVEMAATGAGHDKYGRKTVEVSPQEATLKMSGFNPSRIAEESQVKSANMQDINLVRVRKQEIVNQWAYGMAHKDRGEIEAAKAKLREWNEKNPEMKIRVSIDAVARKAKNLNTTGRERFLKSMPKEMRRKAIDELG